ncbi:MAG: dihydrodipicolinate synthase family protein [Albidovulum sp.]|nr:dihydrodipicolinate synthase family protein [Albidovulum sp.]
MTFALSGILPVLPTPFRRDGGIDGDAMKRLVEFALSKGAAGLVFPGFASEVEYLSRGEREELLGVVADEAKRRVVIVAGASADSAEEVIAHGRTALRLRIDHLMIQPPIGIGSTAKAVAEFLNQVASALPKMRFVLQNAPAPRGSDLSPATIAAVVKAVPRTAYVKEETLPAGPAISAILANKPDGLLGAIGGGGARYIIDEYRHGACAAMPAIELTDIHSEIDSAFHSGDMAEARVLYGRTLPLLLLQAIYRMRLTKHVMMRRGILSNARVRARIPLIDECTVDEIDENLAILGLLDERN